MAIVLVISEIISRKYNIISSLAFSALILLLINPLVICDVGFILSFGGTIGIALLNSNIQISIKKYIKIKLLSETLSVTISALIILTPITILYFNTLSIVAIITNIIAVPIAGVITIIGFLLVIFGQISFHISVLLSYSIYILLSLIIVSSSFLSKLPFSNILLTTPKVSTILIYYYIIYRIYKGNFNKKVLYVILLYIFILFIFNLLPRPYVELNFIDVGQGDCCLIQTKHNKTILIDGGGSDSSNFDVGENIVLPYILDKGISRIDLMVLSHPHDDHIEGLITILNNLKVKELIISSLIIPNEKYTELINIARDKNVKISYVSLGDNIYLDGIRFIVIHPKNPLTDINDNSLILKFEYEKASALFTGDISSIVENTLKIGAIDILKVAHHGSSKSSSLDFISNVKPKLSIISVGVNNYGQPNKDVINNLSKFSIPVCTKDNGEINIKLYKNGLIKYSKCIN
jgi:competence protein ComEC